MKRKDFPQALPAPPPPQTHTHSGGVRQHQLRTHAVVHVLQEFWCHPSPGRFLRLGSRWHSRKAEWGHWSCPWSWKKGDPGLRAAYLFFPENDAPHQGRGETQADLRQDLEGSGDQERELALNDEVPESEGEARAPSSQDAFVDEEAMESDQAALDENVECPREEDRVLMQASTGGQTCSYVLVKRRRTFKKAQVSGM